ncbi:S8 family peptidase [Anaeromyxobacter sp. Fw109-5]|uniref:S8 family peptidase n=1 Tax=Anaeromyxobacter sp. (strain Fw109-5) TaxID=404589 RepID=UPI0002F46AA3|nr:S8 family peptidase [Anaeromyxobacter sp. Fw109-5]
MAKPRIRRHLFVRDAPNTERFTSVHAGGGKPRVKAQDRGAHARDLEAELDTAAAAAEDADRPVRIDFHSEPGFELALASLDSTRPGAYELLAVRHDGDVTIATVLVERKSIKHFRKAIEEYAAKDTRKGLPAHERLIANISAIHRASVRSIWTDEGAPFPANGEAMWWEAWLRRREGAIAGFRARAVEQGLRPGPRTLAFIDRLVTTVYGTVEQMGALFEEDDALAELRRAKELSTEFLSLTPREQAEWARDLRRRVVPPGPDAPSVCLLDTGVNRGHILLEPLLDARSTLSCDEQWGANDHNGHGTEMAGLAGFGDLAPLLMSGSLVPIRHRLESVKILPPAGNNEREVYGALTQEAVARAEAANPDRARAVCLTVTTRDGRDQGKPSSWSAAIDQFAAGALDDQRRLFCVSAGNADVDDAMNYPTSNETDSIHDPGQSWNAITVGALADRVDITEPEFHGWSAVAPAGDLGPCSTTSSTWPGQRRWPIKPEILMPGGNIAINPDRTVVDATDSLSLLTTHWMPIERQFTTSGDTSAAAALAARLAARIQADYRQLWPETVRGLIVHAAEWTEAMRRRFPAKNDVEKRLRFYGFGVPDEAAAVRSADDALTLIAQNTIQPFIKEKKGKSTRFVTADMHVHRLPWPTDVLTELGERDVDLRVTLSYFIEPSPGERGWKQRHRYASHGLRFELKTATETFEQFRTRINRAARAEDEKPTSKGDQRGWTLGPDLRTAGSIHSDTWTGPAIDLARRSAIAIYPAIGWWRERHHLGRWNQKTRYSLVVSIRTPGIETDIYTPVAIQLGIPVPTEIA